MKTHEVKCWPEFFQAMADGFKQFDCRMNDRDYQVGDVVVQREWSPGGPATQRDRGEYTGRELAFLVTYILRGKEGGTLFGVMESYVVLGLRLTNDPMPVMTCECGQLCLFDIAKVKAVGHLSKKLDRDHDPVVAFGYDFTARTSGSRPRTSRESLLD